MTPLRTDTVAVVDAEDLRSLSRILLYGGAGTRRALARRLAAEDSQELWRLLVSTVRSDEPWLLRARCLEVIGIVAGSADPRRTAAILEALLEPDRNEGSPLHRSVTIS